MRNDIAVVIINGACILEHHDFAAIFAAQPVITRTATYIYACAEWIEDAFQGKELLLEMLDDEELNQVVVLLAAMPTSKCAKIMAEFRTAEEITQLNDILRKIREGYPEHDLADGTLAALDQTARTDRGGTLR